MNKDDKHFCMACGATSKVSEVVKIINGVKRNIYLCSSCLNKFLVNEQMSIATDFTYQSDDFSPNSTIKHCLMCMKSWHDFQKDGLLGCSKCYETFRSEVEEYLDDQYSLDPKRTIFVHNTDVKSITLSNLKIQLKQAISEENFELAASLRDRINREEGSDG